MHGHFRLQVAATKAINECISGLYNEGLFIKADRAAVLARKGLEFLSLYADVAKLCYQRKMKRFPLVPKLHYLHHQFLELLHQSERSMWCMNVLVYANQLEEDFIGRPSRLAHRVSQRTASLRVIQRVMLAVKNHLGSMEQNL